MESPDDTRYDPAATSPEPGCRWRIYFAVSEACSTLASDDSAVNFARFFQNFELQLQSVGTLSVSCHILVGAGCSEMKNLGKFAVSRWSGGL